MKSHVTGSAWLIASTAHRSGIVRVVRWGASENGKIPA